MREAIEFIGAENLERIALEVHKPAPAIYLFVSKKGNILTEIRNESRISFNSKYKMMDYYSELVSMQKPVASKLILSNKWMTFFCRNVEKLTEKDMDDYFEATGLPEEYDFFRTAVKENIWKVKKGKLEIVKFFLLEDPGMYREFGLRNWLDKAISKNMTPAKYRGMGFPVSCGYNPKKPYQRSRMYFVDEGEGLQIKLFHDILKGLKYRGYNMLVVSENVFIPLKPGELPSTPVQAGVIIAFDVKHGNAQIIHMDTINYKPWL